MKHSTPTMRKGSFSLVKMKGQEIAIKLCGQNEFSKHNAKCLILPIFQLNPKKKIGYVIKKSQF